jgi:BASS family bile acid:Na+ symporter
MSESALLDIGLPLVLGFVMIGIGMTLSVGDFQRQRKEPKPVLIGLLGQVIAVPILGFAIAWLFNLPAGLAIGLILVAATSGGTTSNVMTYLAKGNVAMSLVLTVVANIASILSLPFWASRALDVWGADVEVGSYVSVGFGDVAGLLLAIVVIPVSIGMFIRTRRPELAARLERTVSLVSFVALFGLIIGVALSLGDEAVTMLAQAGPATLVLATSAVLLGFALGILFRLDRRDHIALGMEFGIKNVTLTMLLALTALGSEEIALPAAVYGVLAYIPAMTLVYLGRRYVGQEPIQEQEPSKRPVVVGYDGAPATQAALSWAAQEALAMGRPLRVLLAWGTPTMGISPVSRTSQYSLDAGRAGRTLQEAVDRLRVEVPGLDIEGELVQSKPAQALLDMAPRSALIVVGHQSKSRVGRLALGSVASAVVTHADTTVVVVPSAAGTHFRRQGPVVVGVDGSPGSELAVEYAMEATTRHGLQLVAVHVTDKGSASGLRSGGGGFAVAAPDRATGLLAISAALKAGRSEFPAVEVREVVETGSPAERLLAECSDAALLVVGSRGHGGFAGLLLGSVGRAVLEAAACPVAVVRRAD